MGRDDALTAMVDALRDGPTLVLVEGEPGIGKSRLVREVLSSPDVADRRIVVAGCPPVPEPFPLGPLIDGVRRLHADVDGIGLSLLGGALRPLFPEWAEQLPPALEGLDDAKETRHRLFGALTELIQRLEVDVLVVEDVHWADTASLEWLLTLAAAESVPCSVVVTYRPTDVPEGSLLPRLTSRVPAGMGKLRLELEPLDVADTRRLVESMLSADAVSDKFATFLHERTDGLPLAVEESVRLLRERHDIIHQRDGWSRRVLDELEVPPTVRDSVLERVDRLPPEARLILQAAAIITEPADEALLVTVADLGEKAGRQGIAHALASGLLREAGGGRLAFRHVLDAQAVEHAIPASKRWLVHRRTADALHELKHPPVARLARHYRAANDTEQWSTYAEAAADLALQSGDDHTAVVTLLDILNTDEHSVDRRARLARKLGQAASYEAALPGDLGDRVPATLLAVLADDDLPETERGLIRFFLGKLLYMRNHDAAAEEIEAAVPDLTDRPAQAARAMLHLAMPLTPSWPAGRHLAWLERAADLLPKIESGSERLSFLVNRASVLLLLGQEEGWQAAAEIPLTASSALDNKVIANGLLNMAQAATTWGRYAEARSRLALAAQISTTAHARQRMNTARVAGAYLDWYTGEWEGLAETAAQLAEAEETRTDSRLEARIVQGLVELASGHRIVAERRLRAVGDEFARRGFMEPQAVPQSAIMGRLQLADGETFQALDVTTPVVEMIASKGVWLWAADIASVHVDALIAIGELAAADAFVDQFASGLTGCDAPAPTAAVELCQAILAAAKGDLDRAITLLDQAAQAWATLPRPYDELLTRERQGRCLLEAGQQDAAREVLSDAQRRLHELGALWDADRVAQILRQHGVEVARVWRRGPRGYGDQLSPRELEVARLVARGMTNKQIGEALFLSPRTVERHVRNAMRKLDVSSRTALAMAVTDAGLVSDE